MGTPLSFEDTIKDAGFTSVEEFNRMIASVDLSTPEKLAAFKKWQHEDGSKEGLMKL